MLERRYFLKSAGAAFLSQLLPKSSDALAATDCVFAAAFQKPDGGYGLALLNDESDVVSSIDLPKRGHDVAYNVRTEKGVVFARRPGNYAVVFCVNGKVPPFVFHAPKGRHFYGHGCFSSDGRLLYATENDFENAQGVIGVYEIGDKVRRVGEFPSFGVGPHAILKLPQENIIVVANGGIETHPDFARVKLNLSTMKPNIAFIDTVHGGLLEKHELEKRLQKLSIRHMALGENGAVWFACQNQLSNGKTNALFGKVSLGGQIDMVSLPDEISIKLRGYIGSIAFNKTTKNLFLTSPRGHVGFEYGVKAARVVGDVRLRGVCGVAEKNAGFILSSGTGVFLNENHNVNWDNHITSLK